MGITKKKEKPLLAKWMIKKFIHFLKHLDL